MKIGYITTHNVHNINAWSGTIFFTYKTLCQLYGKKNIIICRKNKGSLVLCNWIEKWIRKISKKFNYEIPTHNFINSFFCGFTYNKRELEEVDLLFAPAASIDIAFLKTKKPIIYLSDATFALMIDYYKEFSNLRRIDIYQGNQIEKRALEKCAYFISCSEWAKNSAIDDYGIAPNKIKTIPLGACLPFHIELETANINQKEINLLFLGGDWQRKGGDIAVECCRILRHRGYNCFLNIIGIQNLNENISGLSFIRNFGYLNKVNRKELEQWYTILFRSDFLLLPTHAECAGIAFCEASAFGLPSITFDTGGVGDYVLDGINGYKLPLSATANDFAGKIIEILQKDEYEELSSQSVELYHKLLNWDTWGNQFHKLVQKILNVPE